MMLSRIMETVLLYVVDTLSSSFENLKMYMNDEIEKGRGQWIRAINDYREKVEMSWEDLRNIDKKTLKNKIKEYDAQIWLQEMFHKPTLRWYRLGKSNIGYEMCYCNNICSTYLAKARTNSLQLEEHLGRGQPNYDKTCKLCGQEEEDLEHFIVRCPELEGKRNPEIMEEGPPINSEEKTVHILFGINKFQETAAIIRGMWTYRKHRRDDLRPS